MDGKQVNMNQIDGRTGGYGKRQQEDQMDSDLEAYGQRDKWKYSKGHTFGWTYWTWRRKGETNEITDTMTQGRTDRQ